MFAFIGGTAEKIDGGLPRIHGIKVILRHIGQGNIIFQHLLANDFQQGTFTTAVSTHDTDPFHPTDLQIHMTAEQAALLCSVSRVISTPAFAVR